MSWFRCGEVIENTSNIVVTDVEVYDEYEGDIATTVTVQEVTEE